MLKSISNFFSTCGQELRDELFFYEGDPSFTNLDPSRPEAEVQCMPVANAFEVFPLEMMALGAVLTCAFRLLV